MKKLYWTHTIHPTLGPVDGWSDTPGEPGHTPPPVDEAAPVETVTEPEPTPAKEQKHGKREHSRK
jgi:hypothetical protein